MDETRPITLTTEEWFTLNALAGDMAEELGDAQADVTALLRAIAAGRCLISVLPKEHVPRARFVPVQT